MKKRNRTSGNNYPRIFLLILFIVLWIFSIIYIPFSIHSHMLKRWDKNKDKQGYDIDYRCFLVPGHMIRNGDLKIYDYEHFSKFYHITGIIMGEPGSISYPPTFYTFMIPFTYFPFQIGADLWLISKYFAILWSAMFLAYLVLGEEVSPVLKLLLVLFLSITIYAFSPTQDDLSLGQINLHILFLLCASLFLLKEKMPILSGVLLGLIFCIKFISGPIIIYMLFKKKWKVVIPAISVILLLIMLTIFIFGPGLFIDYFRSFHTKISFGQYITNPSILRMLTLAFPFQLSVVHYLHSLISLIILGAAYYRLLKGKGEADSSYSFSLLITTALIISPTVWPSPRVWLFIPLIFIGKDLFLRKYDKVTDWLLALFMILFYFSLAVLDTTLSVPETHFKYFYFNRGFAFILPFIFWIILLLYPQWIGDIIDEEK